MKKGLVLEINEAFHDAKAQTYIDYNKKDNFSAKKSRWRRIYKKFAGTQPKTILDYGTGTGFSPITVSDLMSDKDLFICADISEITLKVCAKTLKASNLHAKIKFLKIKGLEVYPKEEELDMICMNSVLHHLPDIDAFFENAYNTLKKGGVIIAGHDPNKYFYDSFLFKNYWVLSLFFSPSKVFVSIMKKIGIYQIIRNIFGKFSKKTKLENEILEKVNEILIKKGKIKNRLPFTEILKAIDYNSPSAGKYEKNKGLDLKKIMEKHKEKYKLEYFESFNHLRELSGRNWILRKYNSFLQKKFPKKGATMYFVLKKI